jgi:catecholate siderophore receptor
MASARGALGLATFGITSAAAVTSAFGQATGQTVVASNDPNKIETVNVTARRPSLTKVPDEILNTPQSINVVPLQVMQEQGVTNLQDALKNVPGITLNAGEGGSHGDQVNLRGFSASDDFFLDGLRDTGFYTRDSFNYDALEVYKGPASTLFGRGSTGGVINQVSKTPQLYPILSGTASVGTADLYRETIDINEPFSDDDAFRINAMDDTSHYEGRPDARTRRLGFAPSVAFGIGTPTTFMLSWYHEEENNVPDYGIPFLDGHPAPVPHNADYELTPDTTTTTDVNILTGTFNHDFNGDLSISDKARWGFYRFDTRQTAPHYGDANCFTGAAPFAGAPICTGASSDVPVTPTNPLFPVAGQPLNQIFVQRDRPSVAADITTLMNETDLTARFTTGPFLHTLIVGAEEDKEEADLIRFVNQDIDIVATPLLAPDPLETFPGHQTAISSRPDTKTDTVGLYAIDTIQLAPQWSLVGALREDRFHATYNEPVSDSNFDHTDWILTPRAALIFKPTESQSYYFSYGTSFDPSAENLSLSPHNADLGPEKDHTFEVGGKQQILGGLASITEAVFDTQMDNARIADPTNPSLQALAGDLKIQGVEIDIAGNITEHLEMFGGYTYLTGTSSGLFGVGVSGPIPNTAHNQANLWTTYDFDSGLKLGLGANWLGMRRMFKDESGGATVPGYITYDAMAAYQVTDNVQLQLNAYNLFNKFYYANAYFTSEAENHVIPGAGRTVVFTVALNY